MINDDIPSEPNPQNDHYPVVTRTITIHLLTNSNQNPSIQIAIPLLLSNQTKNLIIQIMYQNNKSKCSCTNISVYILTFLLFPYFIAFVRYNKSRHWICPWPHVVGVKTGAKGQILISVHYVQICIKIHNIHNKEVLYYVHIGSFM